MTKFIEIQTCYRGNVEDEIINIYDISRIVLGANTLYLRTPDEFGRYGHSITKESVDKLLKVLEIEGE